MNVPVPQRPIPAPAELPPAPTAALATADGIARAARKRRVRRRTLALALLLVALAIGWAWMYLPVASAPSVASLLAFAEQAHTSPLAPFIALACFAIGGLVVFPVNLLIAATVVVFGPLAGAFYALLGSLASAIVVHEVGRRLPAAIVVRLLGSGGERLRLRVVGRGLLAVAVVRLVPVAPYSVVSLMSGVARIRRVDYVAGTALGMLPGIVLYALFVDRARAVLLDPNPLAWAGLIGALILIVAVALGVRLWYQRQESTPR